MRAYWFGGDTLPHGDGRPVAVGVTHTVEPPIVPCWRGLHASVHPSDALKYAQCASLWLVDLAGEIEQHGSPPDKLAASERTYIARIDATDLLREHARWCASQVLHLWDAPDVVRQYLATGEESIRDAAGDAARAATWDAARAAARSAARSAARAATWDAARAAARSAARSAARAATWDAAWAATRAAAWDAAWDAAWAASRAAAWDAAWSAAWAAARAAAGDAALNAQRAHLLGLVEAAFRREGGKP